MSDVPQMPERTPFVTVVAWIFIALATMILISSLLQTVVFGVMSSQGLVPMEQLEKQFQGHEMYSLIRLTFKYMWVFITLSWVAGIVMMVSSIGLLKRREWARKIFVVLLILMVFYQLAGMVWQGYFTEKFMAPAMAPGEFGSYMTIVMVFSIIMGLAFSGLFVWIIIKLMSKKMRAQFS